MHTLRSAGSTSSAFNHAFKATFSYVCTTHLCGGSIWKRHCSSIASTSKHLAGPTISRVPRCHQYVLDNSLRRTEEEAKLQDEIDKAERALMAGSSDESQFLAWLVKLTQAKRVLEVGVFRGSTTLKLALAVPEHGKVVALDLCPEYAKTGQKYWELSKVSHKIDFRVGLAGEWMDALIQDAAENPALKFDLVFIDADKVNYDAYYEKALALLNQNGIVAVDNTLWGGRVLQPEDEQDADTRAIVSLNKKLHADKRVDISMLSIADGLTLARKL
eukprot:TRINITY_DN81854_c0_g1_i1.p1 TRINITY_DN81854_c0_g1~~TRINITY_DN81854_c0_g1_i1.p1  ORF type:complete len:274 (+),score=51.33 TRINITY_DN81854_c0_g1_i1:10-831(+)